MINSKSRRAGSAVAAAMVIVLCSVGVPGLAAATLAPTRAAGLSSPSPAPSLAPSLRPSAAVDPVTVPEDVTAAVAAGPTDLLVGFDAVEGVRAGAAAAGAASGPTARQSVADQAAEVFERQKDAVVDALPTTQVHTAQEYDQLPVELVTVSSLEGLAELVASPGVTSVALPQSYSVSAEPGATLVRQPQAAAAGYAGAGATVAVIDTGADYTRSGVGDTFGDCSSGPGTGTCRIARITDVSGTGKLDSDPGGHGTNVAGVVAAIAPAARIDVYGVFNSSGTSTNDATLLAALNAVLQDGPSRGVRSVNISIGDSARIDSECSNSTYAGVFQSLRSAGIVPVVAAGNGAGAGGSYRPGVSSLACPPGAVRVGAVYAAAGGTRNWSTAQCSDVNPVVDQIACFSQGGSLLSVVAPGVDVRAAGLSGSGTSQAAPHVSAVIAVLAAAQPAAGVQQIVDAVTGSGPTLVDRRDGRSVHRLDVVASLAGVGVSLQRPGTYVSLTPARIVDTRSNQGAGGPVTAGQAPAVQVAGRGGVPATGVSAVVATVTVTGPTGSGVVAVYPSGAAAPGVSNLNYAGGQTVANLVTVPVGADGRWVLSTSGTGTTQLIVDIAGYYTSGQATVPGSFAALTPSRIADSRSSQGLATLSGSAAGALQVTGQGGVPTAGVAAVVVNVTVTGPASAGNIEVYPSGTSAPGVSNVNFVASQTVPNLVTVPVGPDGKIVLSNNSTGSADLIVDVAGYYLSGSAVDRGAFVPVRPARIADSRSGLGFPGRIAGGTTADLVVAGTGGVPSSGAQAIVVNATVTDATDGGWLALYPTAGQVPGVSNVNYAARQTVPNLAVVTLGGGRSITAFAGGGSPQVILDLAGYFIA